MYKMYSGYFPIFNTHPYPPPLSPRYRGSAFISFPSEMLLFWQQKSNQKTAGENTKRPHLLASNQHFTRSFLPGPLSILESAFLEFS